MGKFVDLTNNKYGQLTAIRYEKGIGWLCRCDCGNTKYIKGYELLNKKVMSCGHNRYKVKDTNKLVGKQFGRLTVSEYIGNYKWKCKCSCNNYTNVLEANLINGTTLSCGCLKQEIIDSKATKQDILSLIYKHKNNYGYAPFIKDLAIELNLSTGYTQRLVNEYSLNNLLNSHFSSFLEKQVYETITKYNNQISIELHNRKIIKPLELDIYIPELKLAFEINGNFWHNSNQIDKYYHQNKTIACEKQGVHLVHIFEYEWNTKELKEKIEQYIHRLVTKNVCNKDIIVKQLNIEQEKELLNHYCLEDCSKNNIKIGCIHNNKIVEILMFKNIKDNKYEMAQLYCTDTIYTEATQRIFNYFIEKFNPTSIIVSNNKSKFNDNTYIKLGFKVIKITEPEFIWWNISKNSIQQSNSTNLKGYAKIYDCGQSILEWKKGINYE